MIGHQQAATGITGLKTTLQPAPEGAEGAPTVVVSAMAGQENGKELEEVTKAQNPAAGETEAPELTDGEAKKDNTGEGDDDGDEEPISMKFPLKDGWQKILLYLISFPLMAPLYVTLPDTKDKSSKPV